MVESELQPSNLIPEPILLQHQLKEQWRRIWAVLDSLYDALDLSAEADPEMLD